MATNPYVNKVVYGNQTVMDISDTTATAADVADGEVFYAASGQRVTGSYTPPTLISLTPDNDSPATITSGTDYHATAGGYAIESYSSVNPNVSTYTNPPYVEVGNYYKIINNNGYLILQYSSITPTESGQFFNAGMIKMSSRGYAYTEPPSVKHYTTNVTFSDNTTYQYIATGKYAGLKIKRGNLTSAAKIQVYVRDGTNYRDVSGEIATTNGTVTVLAPTTGTYVNTSGRLYVKKNSGSNFTSTEFDFQYI